MPFERLDGTRPAVARLIQVSEKDFLLEEGFRYYHAGSGETYEVDPKALRETDLASIPWFLRWFTAGYGRLTLSALLHDQLVKTPGFDRSTADSLFRDSMGEGMGWLGRPQPAGEEFEGVGLVKRWIMWSAVTAATLIKKSGWYWPLLVLWGLAWLGSIAFFVIGIVLGDAALWLSALAAPVLLSLLWAPLVGAGLIAGYTLMAFLPAIALVALAFGIYWILEWTTMPLQRAMRRLRPLGYEQPPIAGPGPWAMVQKVIHK